MTGIFFTDATMEIILKLEKSRCDSDVYNEGSWSVTDTVEVAAKEGEIYRFFGLKITEIHPDEIVFTLNTWKTSETKVLHPGETITFGYTVDGDERSDGCVYDWTSYSLKIEWPEL